MGKRTYFLIATLMNDEVAICFLNRGKEPQEIEFDWSRNTIVDDVFDYQYNFNDTQYDIRDLWAHKKAGSTKKPLKTTIPGHDVHMIKLTPKKY